jgi:hypothetical protein
MKPRLADSRVIALAIVLSVVFVPVLAAESDKATDEDYTSSNVPLVHLTPFVVLDSSLGSRVGGAVAMRWKRRVSVEVDTDYGSDVLTSTGGLVWRTASIGRLAFHLVGGGGLERRAFSSPVKSDAGSRYRLGTAVGAGADVSLNSKWAVRADVRWFNDEWRLASGVTLGLGR